MSYHQGVPCTCLFRLYTLHLISHLLQEKPLGLSCYPDDVYLIGNSSLMELTLPFLDHFSAFKVHVSFLQQQIIGQALSLL